MLSASVLETVNLGREIVRSLVSPKLGVFELDVKPTDSRMRYVWKRGLRVPVIEVRSDAEALDVAHEIVHDIETRHPEIKKATRTFLMKRAKEGGTVTLSEITGKPEDTDIVYLDRWKELGGDVYTGRFYPDGSTEILSMGIERLYENADLFSEKDPEFFEFVVRTLRGW